MVEEQTARMSNGSFEEGVKELSFKISPFIITGNKHSTTVSHWSKKKIITLSGLSGLQMCVCGRKAEPQ